MTVGGAGGEQIGGRLLPLVGVAASRADAEQMRLVGLAAEWRASVALLLVEEVEAADIRRRF